MQTQARVIWSSREKTPVDWRKTKILRCMDLGWLLENQRGWKEET